MISGMGGAGGGNGGVSSSMDYNRVECIQRKRLLAFVNHFVAHTVDFLSNFSQNCEDRLQQVEARIQKMDSDLELLECKLDSIPELRTTTSQSNQSSKTVQFRPSDNPTLDGSKDGSKVDNYVATTTAHSSGDNKAQIGGQVDRDNNEEEDPELRPFAKMIMVGVPPDAVRQKMLLHGFDATFVEEFLSRKTSSL